MAVIAAVTHRRSRAGALLGNPVLLWIGIRSYGLYLYHWPIYQMMRGVAGRNLSVAQFDRRAWCSSLIVTELSYRFIETPIRRGHVGRWWRRLQSARDPAPRRVIAGAGAAVVAMSVFAVANLATAQLKQNEIAESLDEGAGSVTEHRGPARHDHHRRRRRRRPPGPPSRRPAAAADSTVPRPATTVPTPTTVPATVPATPPPATAAAPTIPPNPIFAIGDSVMLGAADELAEKGIVVDAEVSRQMKTMVPVVQQLAAAGRARARRRRPPRHQRQPRRPDHDRVLHRPGRRAQGARADGPRPARLRGREQRQAAGAAVAVPQRHRPVLGRLANECPGNCFYDDGIHLRQDGQDYYADLIFQQLGIQ